jgi:hypothetical protein
MSLSIPTSKHIVGAKGFNHGVVMQMEQLWMIGRA